MSLHTDVAEKADRALIGKLRDALLEELKTYPAASMEADAIRAAYNLKPASLLRLAWVIREAGSKEDAIRMLKGEG